MRAFRPAVLDEVLLGGRVIGELAKQFNQRKTVSACLAWPWPRSRFRTMCRRAASGRNRLPYWLTAWRGRELGATSLVDATASMELRELRRWPLAECSEMDLEARTWTVPKSRMKGEREHRVPLSDRAMEILAEARGITGGSGLVFPTDRGRPPSDSTLSKLLRELKVGAVPHGFRSSFRDWAAECSDAPRDVCELALAHVNSDRVEAAYRRTDLFERRRVLMQEWAAYVAADRSGAFQANGSCAPRITKETS